MDDIEIQPLDQIYRLDANAEWKHLLLHLELLEGFGLLFVLTPEQAGAEVCRRALERHFAERQRALWPIKLDFQEPAGALGDKLLQTATLKDTWAVWVSAPEAESALQEETVRLVWRDALAALNPRRNPLRRHLRVPLIFAGPMWLQEICREAAPDLWSIRDAIARIEPPDRDLRHSGQMRASDESSIWERPDATGDPDETRQSLVRLCEKTVPDSESANLELLKARLLHRLAQQLWQRYKWDEAEAALLEAEQIVEHHHQSLDEQMELLLSLSQLLHERGDFVRAERYARKAYEFANAHFGLTDYKTLASRNSIALALSSQGKYAEAELEHRAVLGLLDRVFGAEAPPTLRSRNNLANVLHSQGKYSEAEQENRARIAIEERVLGEEHPDTLASRNNLANVLHSQGKYSEAEQEHRARIAIEERVLGTQHPQTLASRGNLANDLFSEGKYAEAEQEYRAVSSIRERVFGAEHPDTLTTRGNLANVLHVQAKYTEAEQDYRAVLAIRESVLGSEHPDVFQSCHNLALCLNNQERYREALNFAQRAENGFERLLGEDHPRYEVAASLRKHIEEKMGRK